MDCFCQLREVCLREASGQAAATVSVTEGIDASDLLLLCSCHVMPEAEPAVLPPMLMFAQIQPRSDHWDSGSECKLSHSSGASAQTDVRARLVNILLL